MATSSDLTESPSWRCGDRRFSLDRPLVMGILNVTPDSFSDGGLFVESSDALAHAREMLAAGADIIDVGGESTRPGAEQVPFEEEVRRTFPVVEELAREAVPVSIDTRDAGVAATALSAGACVINDVSGMCGFPMVATAVSSTAGVIVMHMQGEPATMQVEPHYDDVVVDVSEFLLERAQYLESAGVARDRIAIDPGIGFGKTTEHNLELLRRLPEIVALGYPVVVGASRKRFIGEIAGVEEPRRRLAGSIAAALAAVAGGASIVRVHDVAETVQALSLWKAIGSSGALG